MFTNSSNYLLSLHQFSPNGSPFVFHPLFFGGPRPFRGTIGSNFQAHNAPKGVRVCEGDIVRTSSRIMAIFRGATYANANSRHRRSLQFQRLFVGLTRRERVLCVRTTNSGGCVDVLQVPYVSGTRAFRVVRERGANGSFGVTTITTKTIVISRPNKFSSVDRVSSPFDKCALGERC